MLTTYYIIGTIASTVVIVGAFGATVRWLIGRIDTLENRVITQGEKLAKIEGKLGV